MARITHVKRAQQRYALVPKLDADGSPVTVPYLTKSGAPKVTKHGRPVVAKVTVEDRTKPLPMPKCEKCGNRIEVGAPYKHVTPQTGPYGGQKRFRCGTCPTWQPWDLSNALWARVAQIVDTYSSQEINEDSEVDDVTQILADAAGEIRDLAAEKHDAADNLEQGFGHETEQVTEIRQQGDDLESWADDMENVSLSDKPEDPGDGEPGEAWGEYQSELANWVDEMQSEVSSQLEASPV